MKNTKDLIDPPAFLAGVKKLRAAAGARKRNDGRQGYWFRGHQPQLRDAANMEVRPVRAVAQYFPLPRGQQEGESDTAYYVREWATRNHLVL